MNWTTWVVTSTWVAFFVTAHGVAQRLGPDGAVIGEPFRSVPANRRGLA